MSGFNKFHEMRVFAAVIDAGSFVGASRLLNLSRTAVSRHVLDLEARLGVRLLHRTTRTLSPTPEGLLFHARCRELLDQLDDAEAEVARGSQTARGVLRLSVPATFGQLHLAPLWPRFLQRHPGLTLDVTLSDRAVDLVDEGFDLAVRIGRLASSTLVARKLAETRLIPCASPGYLARHGTPAHPADLAEHAVIAYSHLSTGDTWEFTGPDGPASVRVRPRMRTNSGDTCRAAALQDQGIILEPSFIIGADLDSGALCEILPGYRGLTFGVHAVYPSHRLASPKVRLLVDFLVESFATPNWRD